MRTVLNKRSILSMALGGAVAALGFAAAGCAGDGSGDSGAAVAVVATTTQVADFARNVGGERAEVTGLLAPNSDPHDYEPRPSDVAAVAEADVVLQSGGELDIWLDGVVESSGTDAEVVELIDAVDTIAGGEHANADDETDPHWWHDPRNAVLAVEAIADAFATADPDGASEYRSNAAAYAERIENLDAMVADCVDAIPAGRRKMVTSHDSLGYLANRYGIEVVGAAIPALTTQAQPSAGELAELVELIRDEDVRAVFPEAGVSDHLQQTLATETGARVGGELWADTLGPEGSRAETYLEASARNAEALVDGLSGGAQGCMVLGEDSGGE
ncbi:MAG TPA: zinc ABC transporter substrate-binding protein [Solirubrobacterales bacterium]|nr:zinc ABC transporter substrate-binding protein [Solirubrobacterales bacterium]